MEAQGVPQREMQGRSGARILALWLPHLSTDRLVRTGKARPERPFAVFARQNNALRLSAVSAAAEALGVRRGQSLADARGAVPDLDVHEADVEADMAFLEALAEWCDRYTPLVALDAPDGLFLDITGCAHLFDSRRGAYGEMQLCADLLGRLAGGSRGGLRARAAVAATPGAAWALARFGGAERTLLAGGEEGRALAGLPVAALRLSDEQAALLDRFGLKRIGQLIGQPRAPLAARIGLSLVRRLDQALGFEDEPLSPRRPAPELSAERRFVEPLGDQAAVLAVVRSLAEGLAGSLERLGSGARHLELVMFRADGGVRRAAVATSRPSRKAEDLAGLFKERLERFGERAETDLGFDTGSGLDMIRLAVLEIEALDAAQVDLAGRSDAAADFGQLVDRAAARLGPGCVTRLLPADSHIPERAFEMPSVIQAAAPRGRAADMDDFHRTPFDPSVPERPVNLFDRPEPIEVVAQVPEGPPSRFRWRWVLYDVVRADGPERIAPEWWLDAASGAHSTLTRDYYRVEDRQGRRYWLYRDGLYERETARPGWFMHGLFA
jgi:protein ImuB